MKNKHNLNFSNKVHRTLSCKKIANFKEEVKIYTYFKELLK